VQVEPGEAALETAVRELEEESGLRVRACFVAAQ
jgi:8-oxo-dGTP pyrophosphatase MutT (NUDIX family)